MDWTFTPHDELTPNATEAWQELTRQVAPDNPALELHFLDRLARYFGDGDELVAVCMDKSVPVAATILKPVQPGAWNVFVPGQGCLSPLLIGSDADDDKVIAELMQAIPGACLLLRLPQADPDVTPTEIIVARLAAERASYGTTYSVDVSQPFDTYWSARSKNLRRSLRKAFQRIDDEGYEVSLRVHTDAQEVPGCVATHGDLESSGWKGAAGTAIHAGNRQGKFYVDALTRFARDRGALIAQLYFDAAVVASLLCIVKNGTLVVLKTTYREEHAKLAPGRVLDYLFLEHCCETEALRIADMYTKASKSDLSWASETRELVDVDVYRSVAAKTLARLRRKVTGFITKPS